MKHRLLLLVCAGMAAGGIVLATSGPATSSAGAEVCLIKGSAVITPGLTTTPKAGTVSISGNLSLCHGSNLKITKGTVNGTASGTGSCAASVDSLSATITWSNLQTSTISGTLTSQGALATFVGTVKSGLFAGSPITTTAEFTPQGGATKATACKTTTGLTNVTFEGVTS